MQAYGFQKSNINDVRYEKCCGEKFPKPSKIVPIKDKLHQHIKQGKYEAFVWKNALEANEEIREADQHGCDVIDGTCKDHVMDNQTASEKGLEFVVRARKKNVLNNVLLQIERQASK